MNRYHIESSIGKGTYATVFKAVDLVSGVKVALKKIRLEKSEEGIPSTAIREISLLKQLQHDHVVKLYDVIHGNYFLTLVFELLDKDLKIYLEVNGGANGGGLEEDVVKSFMRQLLAGISHCHERGIIHRDLKPQNLLINKENQLKIADFGLARAFGVPVRSFTREIITLWYRPSEILLGQSKYSTPVDIWSVGCIFGEMFTGNALFKGSSEPSQLELIFSKLGQPNYETIALFQRLPDWKPNYVNIKYSPNNIRRTVEKVSSEAQDLLFRLLEFHPRLRISGKKALTHKYFSKKSEDVFSSSNLFFAS